jgi:hypothetical protein
VANRAGGGGEGAFYSPQKESTRWDVRDPDMSGIGGRTCPEPVSGTRPRCLGLTRVKAKVHDMSGTGTRYVQKVLL